MVILLGNVLEVKSRNRNNIYKLIYSRKRISKQDIAFELNLSLPTVTQNLNNLKERGLIREYGCFESTGGRRAKMLGCVLDAKVAIGLDITKNHISLVIINMQANVLFSKRTRMKFSDTVEYYQNITEAIHCFVNDSEVEQNKILGVGITLPAIIAEDQKTVIYASVLGAPSNFYEKLAPFMEYNFYLYNDANGAGFAEFWNTETMDTLVYLSLSNSVGGAVVSRGTVYYGNSNRGAEFGHTTIVPEGRECYCGQKGCVDAYCSASLLADLTEESRLEDFFECVRNGSSLHRKALDEYLYYLSITVNNLRMSFDCNVVLGGYVGSFLSEYLYEVRSLLAKRNTFEENGDYVSVCNYKFEASAVGAALYYINEYINEI